MTYAVADLGGGTTEVSVVADGVVQMTGYAGGGETSVAEFTPAQARELAAALVRAANEAENLTPSEPVSVKAQELRRGDVRDGDRSMTVDRVKVDEAISTAHVTWKSDAGRAWTQSYAMDTDIRLRRRGPEAAG
ncbi:hypothetical protein [Streptomyces melanogenes]|uniref:Uncharacterized protein n=1 Tax=Streptomyces melanogenes TaxID=67326 RepID=A0ABZ1XEU1_9ACTN|nr:hypothetical protein [Streptomyces melanogenes]